MSQVGTHKTVKARLWTWFEPFLVLWRGGDSFEGVGQSENGSSHGHTLALTVLCVPVLTFLYAALTVLHVPALTVLCVALTVVCVRDCLIEGTYSIEGGGGRGALLALARLSLIPKVNLL